MAANHPTLLAERTLVHPRRGHRELRYSPCGRFFCLVDQRFMYVTSTETGQRLSAWAHSTPMDVINGASFSPDGRVLARGTDSGVELYDWTTAATPVYSRVRRLLRQPMLRALGVSYGKDPNVLAAVLNDTRVLLYDVRSGEEPRIFGQSDFTWKARVTMADDGVRVLVAAADRGVSHLDLRGREPIVCDEGPHGVTCAAFSPDQTCAVAGYETGHVYLIPLDGTGRYPSTDVRSAFKAVTYDGDVHAVSVHPTTGNVLTAATGTGVTLWDVGDQHQWRKPPMDRVWVMRDSEDRRHHDAAFSPYGNELAVCVNDSVEFYRVPVPIRHTHAGQRFAVRAERSRRRLAIAARAAEERKEDEPAAKRAREAWD